MTFTMAATKTDHSLNGPYLLVHHIIFPSYHNHMPVNCVAVFLIETTELCDTTYTFPYNYTHVSISKDMTTYVYICYLLYH